MIQYKRIGEMLIDAGLLTQEQVVHAMEVKSGSSLRFGEVLTTLGYVTEEQVTECLAHQYGYEVADLSSVHPEPGALAFVPSITAMSCLVLPMKVTPEVLTCIIADPLDIPMTDAVFRLADRKVEFKLSPPTLLFDAIVEAYQMGDWAKNQLRSDPVLSGRESNGPGVVETSKHTEPRKRRVKVDPQDDRFALLAALGARKKGVH